jgi:hypothetical protein
VQVKGIYNIVNKIITENFPNLEKAMHIQLQEASRTPNGLDQNRTTLRHNIIKTTSTENRERIMKAVKRAKTNNIHKVNPSKSQQSSQRKLSKKRRAWSKIFWELNENNFNPRILYPAKLSFKIDGTIKDFHDKQKLKQYMTTKQPLQKFFKEF